MNGHRRLVTTSLVKCECGGWKVSRRQEPLSPAARDQWWADIARQHDEHVAALAVRP